MTNHVFISYARLDGANYAEQLDTTLTREGFVTWRDTRRLDPSQDFTAEIEAAIERAECIVTCITPDTRRPDSFVRREIGYAQTVKKPVIVARFANVVPPVSVINHTRIDFFDGSWNDGFSRLLTLLRSGHADLQALETSTPPRLYSPSNDPVRDYLENLYQQLVRYLDKTVFSMLPGQSGEALIPLQSLATPEAVQNAVEVAAQALPMAFFDMAGVESALPAANYENFHTAYERYNGRLLLLGDPGSGKTTTLMAFARDAVARRLNDPTQPIPLVIPVALWDSERRQPFDEWLTTVVPALGRRIVSLLAESRLLLLLDGLDELGSQRERQTEIGDKEIYDPRPLFMRSLPGDTPIVISCRVADYEAIGEKLALNGAVTLQPLDDARMAGYLGGMPELWNVLRADDELREMARTPLLLSLFAFAYAGLSEAAHELVNLDGAELRSRIFETYLARRYAHEQRKPHIHLPLSLDEFYRQLSLVILNKRGQIRDNLYSGDDFLAVGSQDDAARLIALATGLHILVTAPSHQLRFVHQHMRDHIALYPAQKAIQSEPNSPAHHAELARVMRILGRYEDSLSTLRQATERFPLADVLWHERGLAHSLLQQKQDALACLNQAILINPNETWYWHNLGDEFFLAHRYEEALDSFHNALRFNPESALSLAKRGQVLRVMGRYAEASADYVQALRLDPQFAWAWNGNGLALRGMNRLEEALASYERAALLDPASGWYAINAAQLHLRRRNPDKAIDVLKKATTDAQHNPAVWAHLGRILRRLHRHDEALEAYQQALALAPEYAWAWNGKGVCLTSLKRYQEALDAYQKAASFDPTDASFVYHHADALYQAGHLSEAQARYQNVLALKSGHLGATQQLIRMVRGEPYRRNVYRQGDSQVSSGRDIRSASVVASVVYHTLLGVESRSMIAELDVSDSGSAAAVEKIAISTNSSLIFESVISEASHYEFPQTAADIISWASSLEGDYSKEAAKPVRQPDEDFRIGDRIAGRYEVADIRWGGMGVVYLCYDHEQREAVALKTFQSRFLENERAVQRFFNETLTWIRLEKHQNIVQAKLVINIHNKPHIVLEHVSGPEGLGSDLRSWIDNQRIDSHQAILFALQIARGMQHAVHKIPGLVHRDLKPANILVTHDAIAKISDFGLVRTLDTSDISSSEGEDDNDDNMDDRLTRIGAVVGTPPYMSPEQIQSQDVDMRSDIYSFACILYEMLTGRNIFKARKLLQWKQAHLQETPTFEAAETAALPSALRSFTLQCLAKRPEDRPQTWTSVVETLESILTDLFNNRPPL